MYLHCPNLIHHHRYNTGELPRFNGLHNDCKYASFRAQVGDRIAMLLNSNCTRQFVQTKLHENEDFNRLEEIKDEVEAISSANEAKT